MKRRQNLILKSFGAGNIYNPDPLLLAEWIKEQKRVFCDLVSYKIESQIKNQKTIVDLPCTGGIFYRDRILDSVSGIKSGFLISEPFAVPEYMRQDAERIRKFSKNSMFSLPPPSDLLIDDGFYKNRSDFIGSLCSVYKKLMREQRDFGIKEHILTAERFDATELDELCSERVIFFSPGGGSKVLESLLEYQNIIAVFPEKLPVIFELLNEYEVKKIAVINGTADNFEACLDFFDPDEIFAGGFCDLCEDDYWKILKERAFVMR